MSEKPLPLSAAEEASMRRAIRITGKASHCDCVPRLLATLDEARSGESGLAATPAAREAVPAEDGLREDGRHRIQHSHGGGLHEHDLVPSGFDWRGAIATEAARANRAEAARGTLDRNRLARAVELAYENNRTTMGWSRWAGESDAIADEYAALHSTERAAPSSEEGRLDPALVTELPPWTDPDPKAQERSWASGADALATPSSVPAEDGLREALMRFEDIAEGQATDEDIASYRLDAEDPVNRQLNWAEWTRHALIEAVSDLRSRAALASTERAAGEAPKPHELDDCIAAVETYSREVEDGGSDGTVIRDTARLDLALSRAGQVEDRGTPKFWRVVKRPMTEHNEGERP